MTIALADREVRNAIEEAVYVVLGGVREAAKRLDVSTQAVYQLLGAEVVKNRDTALKVEAKTRDGGCEVPAAELMALVPWRGDERHPDLVGSRKGARRVANGGRTSSRCTAREAAATVSYLPTVERMVGTRRA